MGTERWRDNGSWYEVGHGAGAVEPWGRASARGVSLPAGTVARGSHGIVAVRLGRREVELGDAGEVRRTPLDREVLTGLCGLQGENDTDIVAELAGMFVDNTRSGLSALEEAMQRGDAQAVERTAHTLKGSSGSMGARGMSGLCARLERAGTSGDLSHGFGFLERLEEEFGRVERALGAEVRGHRQ